MEELQVRPMNDRVFIKPIEEEGKTAGGIVLPEKSKERPQRATVIAVGPGKLLDNGTRVPLDVKIGDMILFKKHHGDELRIANQDYKFLDESAILAIISEGGK